MTCVDITVAEAHVLWRMLGGARKRYVSSITLADLRKGAILADAAARRTRDEGGAESEAIGLEADADTLRAAIERNRKDTDR